MSHLLFQRMAASNSGPWGPMPGGKPSGSVPQAASRPAPAVITLDDERRRYENVEQARRAQDRFLNSLSHRPNQITPPPPAAHGHMRPRMPPAHSPSGLKKSEAMPGMGHLPPLPHPHGMGHHVHPGHPGPPPPLTPIQSGYNKVPQGHPAQHSGVSFKPYDFPRRDQVSPRGGGGAYPNYPTAYSAPPISRSPAGVPAQAQVVNVYSKQPGSLPSRPESLPPTVGGGATAAPHVNGPPPAHSSLPTSSHKIPQYLPPPLASGGHSQGSVTPSVRQPLPAPPPIAHHPLSNATNSHDDQPLDLGFAPKRKYEEESNPEAGHHHKLFKSEVKSESGSEAGNGLLMRVSEPSALQTTETPSSITTIPNAMHTNSQIKIEPKEESSSSSSPKYVHKLKKAWIKAYTDTGDSNPSPASTPGTNRATPSPAPSNSSSKSTTKNSTKKVNGIHSKDDQSPDPAADESSDSSQAKSKSKSGSVKGSSKARGSGTSSARSTPRLKKTSESDSDNSKDSDVSSRKSGSKGGRGRGRKPGHKKAVTTNGPKAAVASNTLKANNEDNEDHEDRISNSIKKEKENPFNNPPISVLKKTGDSFLQDADCFKVAPKLTKCRECKWSQHNKNAGSSTSIFCRYDKCQNYLQDTQERSLSR